MIEWINRKFGVDLTEGSLTNVKNFSLLWNVFENYVCQSEFSIGRIENILRNIPLTEEEIDPLFEYFKARYVTNNPTGELFDKLRFRANDRKSVVKEILLNDNADIINKVFALTIIIYRLRNNLFHGTKDFRSIEGQEENFKMANNFLMVIVDHFSEATAIIIME